MTTTDDGDCFTSSPREDATSRSIGTIRAESPLSGAGAVRFPCLSHGRRLFEGSTLTGDDDGRRRLFCIFSCAAAAPPWRPVGRASGAVRRRLFYALRWRGMRPLFHRGGFFREVATMVHGLSPWVRGGARRGERWRMVLLPTVGIVSIPTYRTRHFVFAKRPFLNDAYFYT